MKVNIDEFRKNLERLIVLFEISGAMKAFIEASEDTESFEIWKEKQHDTQISGE